MPLQYMACFIPNINSKLHKTEKNQPFKSLAKLEFQLAFVCQIGRFKNKVQQPKGRSALTKPSSNAVTQFERLLYLFYSFTLTQSVVLLRSGSVLWEINPRDARKSSGPTTPRQKLSYV